MCLFFSTLIPNSSITYKYLIQSSTESVTLRYTTSGPGSTIGGVANFQLFPPDENTKRAQTPENSGVRAETQHGLSDDRKEGSRLSVILPMVGLVHNTRDPAKVNMLVKYLGQIADIRR